MSQNHKELFPHTQNSSIEKIGVKTLDQVASSLELTAKILIKVDVQGFEIKVIEGGEDTFKKAEVVLIENSFVELYQGGSTFDQIYQKLKPLGFSYRGNAQQKINKQTGEIISEDSIFQKG